MATVEGAAHDVAEGEGEGEGGEEVEVVLEADAPPKPPRRSRLEPLVDESEAGGDSPAAKACAVLDHPPSSDEYASSSEEGEVLDVLAAAAPHPTQPLPPAPVGMLPPPPRSAVAKCSSGGATKALATTEEEDMYGSTTSSSCEEQEESEEQQGVGGQRRGKPPQRENPAGLLPGIGSPTAAEVELQGALSSGVSGNPELSGKATAKVDPELEVWLKEHELEVRGSARVAGRGASGAQEGIGSGAVTPCNCPQCLAKVLCDNGYDGLEDVLDVSTHDVVGVFHPDHVCVLALARSRLHGPGCLTTF